VANFKQELREYPGRGGAIKSILQRWLDDDRAEDIWKMVTSAGGAGVTAEEFIRFVVRAAMAARALPARIEAKKQNNRGIIAAQRARVAEAFALMQSPTDIADVLEDAAWELRFRENFKTLDGYPDGGISRNRDTQPRRAFSLTMSDFFKERCGKWMDGETGVLLDIVFGPRGEDIFQEVRDYRKAAGRLDRIKSH
jgi:hypothetical protein